MTSRLLTAVLSVTLVFSLGILWKGLRAYHLPGNQQGYEPEQPIAYSHRLHAGELGIDCRYCHFGAERGRYAGIPPAATCMNCHRFVTARWEAVRQEQQQAAAEDRQPRPVINPEVARLYQALAEGGTPAAAAGPQPLEWVRVHRLPDFVYFDHRAHVGAGVECQTCHGPVETMERMRQVADLSMGWCVNCHRLTRTEGVRGRQVQPSTDCTTCHY